MKQGPFFAPGGNSEAFYTRGYNSTLDAPKYVNEIGLDAYEYEAGKGFHGNSAILSQIGEKAKEYHIKMSLHAPYFISLSSLELEKRLNSIEYIRQSIDAADLLGAKTIVVHCGSCSKISREEAMKLSQDTLYKTLELVDTKGVLIGIETMGKKNQLGTLQEVIELCKMSPKLVPVVDFGHLNARECGGVFQTKEDYLKVFDQISNKISFDVAKNLHCHFSKIEWTDQGEKKHLTFADQKYGPDFQPLMDAVYQEGLTPTIVCESAGTQDIDALKMKNYYKSKIL